MPQCLETAWGECAAERKGYRNGIYTRDLATSSGPIKDLEVPRDRKGNFYTQVFDRYNRYEAQVAEGLTEMFVAGVSTQKVGDVAQTLMGVAPSASAVSRLNQTLTQQFETWRERPLYDPFRQCDDWIGYDTHEPEGGHIVNALHRPIHMAGARYGRGTFVKVPRWSMNIPLGSVTFV